MSMASSDREQDVVLVERVTPEVVTVTINRPQVRNALNLDVKRRVADAVMAADADPEIRVIILRGQGSVFVAGTDVAEMVEMTPSSHARDKTDHVFTVLNTCSTPLIAAVEGYALGGGFELAMCCDIIVAAESTKFGQPEIKLGIIPGAGGTQRIVRAAGRHRAMLMLLTGDFMTASEAMSMGLVSELVPDGEAVNRARQIAERIAAMPPLAVSAIRELVRIGPDIPMPAALMLERKAFQILFDSHDQVEGMQAFLEKRPADFTGN